MCYCSTAQETRYFVMNFCCLVSKLVGNRLLSFQLNIKFNLSNYNILLSNAILFFIYVFFIKSTICLTLFEDLFDILEDILFLILRYL